jgi:hypothetical protein
MSVEVCPPSISHLLQSGFSNETILSVMTVAYMQNAAMPNGTTVVPEAPTQKWVVQKFGGESDQTTECAPDGIANSTQGRVWESSQRT